MVKQVGIKELKDQASAIVDQVEHTRKSVTITRNNKAIAKIVPIVTAGPDSSAAGKDFFKSANEELKSMGRISKLPKHDLNSLNLKKLARQTDADLAAIQAISEDRGER